MINLTTLGYAFLGGLLPSLIWLYFLLKEDSRCPEPRHLIFFAFLAGMAVVPFAIAPERYAYATLAAGLPVIISWAVIEEVLKYAVAATFILWRRAVDEAPDYVIYMLTVALGFAALENALFLITPLQSGNLSTVLETNNLRFLGSTLLHVVASSSIGFAFAFSYHLSRALRVLFAAGGLILAVILHAAFNMLIMQSSGSSMLIAALFLVWTMAIVFFAVFEIIKYFRYRNIAKNTC